MPARTDAPLGAPCWVDLMTSDTGGARDFYGRVFGWEAAEPNLEFGGYFNFTKDGALVAGCMQSMGGGTPDVWSVYLASDDAPRTVEAATANGGEVLVAAMAVGELGTMAVVADAGAATIGIWQPALHRGFGVVAEAGAPAWFELHTREYEKAVAFYENVFGWATRAESDTPEFRYTIFDRDGEQYAGIMDASGFLPAGVPAHWSVYFATDDADRTLAEITALGGSVVTAAEDTPYGRLATATDPTGAQFRVVAPNDAMPAQS